MVTVPSRSRAVLSMCVLNGCRWEPKQGCCCMEVQSKKHFVSGELSIE